MPVLESALEGALGGDTLGLDIVGLGIFGLRRDGEFLLVDTVCGHSEGGEPEEAGSVEKKAWVGYIYEECWDTRRLIVPLPYLSSCPSD